MAPRSRHLTAAAASADNSPKQYGVAAEFNVAEVIVMNWVYLLAAGFFEVGFTTCLKLSDGFTRLWPSLGFLVASMLSFYLLTLAMKEIPLGTAYAVWTALGAVGTAVIGMVFFGDPITALRIAFLSLIVVAMVGLKLVSA